MKIAAIATAVALATGSAAFAADYGTHSDRDTSRPAATQKSDAQPTHEGVVAKTKRALHRMGEKMRSAGHRTAQATHTDRDRTAMGDRSDTRSMGAAGSEAHDSARQRRMDEAYSNYQSRHDKDKR